MRTRCLANTSLDVTAITLGTWVLGGDASWGEADDNESVRTVEKAADNGINMIDTAPIYGAGRSEEVVGKALKNVKEKMYIATKCGLKSKGKGIAVDLSAKSIQEEIEDSLRRLGVEQIDLYQCHWPDEKISMEETFSQMNKLVTEGKIRYIGVSNFNKDQLEEALKYAPVVSNQVQYSIFHRDIEKQMLPFCREKGVSILAYGSLGGGVLTGKYKEPPQFPKSDARSFFYTYYREPFWSKARQMVSVLEEIAGKRNVPVGDVAINWVLLKNEVATCIAGCRNEEQLKKNASSMSWELTVGEAARIEEAYKEFFS